MAGTSAMLTAGLKVIEECDDAVFTVASSIDSTNVCSPPSLLISERSFTLGQPHHRDARGGRADVPQLSLLLRRVSFMSLVFIIYYSTSAITNADIRSIERRQIPRGTLGGISVDAHIPVADL